MRLARICIPRRAHAAPLPRRSMFGSSTRRLSLTWNEHASSCVRLRRPARKRRNMLNEAVPESPWGERNRVRAPSGVSPLRALKRLTREGAADEPHVALCDPESIADIAAAVVVDVAQVGVGERRLPT